MFLFYYIQAYAAHPFSASSQAVVSNNYPLDQHRIHQATTSFATPVNRDVKSLEHGGDYASETRAEVTARLGTRDEG